MFSQDIATVRKEDMQSSDLTLKYEKKKRRYDDDKWGRNNESNALRNWQLKMMERKKQQGYISSKQFVILYDNNNMYLLNKN
jgi:hypothetical protein